MTDRMNIKCDKNPMKGFDEHKYRRLYLSATDVSFRFLVDFKLYSEKVKFLDSVKFFYRVIEHQK